ncbi:MAG: gliding motility lipoprotein GldB [Flavobacterium sp.]|nr:gliding motility lipoprotein GldB [Flavobacterium sp.]
MINKLTVLALIFVLFACDKKSKTEKEIDEIPVSVEVERFDKAFFEAKPSDLGQLQQKYPYLFPPQTPNEVWTDKMQDPLWQELYSEVKKTYPDFSEQTQEIETLFKHIKYYYPEVKAPRVITVISEMDYHNKAILADSLLLISLELYLGRDHKFYANEFPEYIRQNFDKRQMMPDVVSSFAQRRVAPPSANTLLAQMVYAGKVLYLKDKLLPEHSDAEKIGYTPEQIAWVAENEGYMWRYFVDNALLYNSDQKLMARFITMAPFSKFYLDVDNESPGRVGTWVGWQIVRSFMKNNEVTLQQMLAMEEKELFEKSRYKPKRNE